MATISPSPQPSPIEGEGGRRFFYGWVIVATMFAVNFSTMATGTLNYGLFVLPMQHELALSRATFGWMQTTRRLSAGVLSFAVGWLIDRYGPRVYIPVAALLIGVCLILVGMSNHAWQFILLFGLVGVTGLAAPNGLVTSVPVAKWFVRKRGRALAFATAGLGISGIVFLPVTQWLIDGYGWRSAWQILAVLFMVISIPAAALFLRRQPEDMGLRVDGDPPDAPADEADPRSRRVMEEEPAWTVRQSFRTVTMWKLVAVFGLSGVAQGGASFHRIPYFVEKAYDPLLVSWSFAADAGGAAATALVAGWLADRVPIRFLAAGSFSGFIVAVLLMIYVASAEMMFLSTILFGCSVGIGMIVHTYIFAAYYGRAFLGTIRGIVMPINLLSAGLGAPLVGYLHDYAGSYLPAWWAILAVYGACSALMLTASPPRQGDEV